MEFDMVAGQGGWLIGPKLFQPEPYPPTCVYSKLCEFIVLLVVIIYPKYTSSQASQQNCVFPHYFKDISVISMTLRNSE